MLAGAAVVGGTYIFAEVELPENILLKSSTTIYYADGVTQMAKIGTENRTIIAFDQMPRHVQQAVVSAEDRRFYTNDSGVDIQGILRAAWNNVTGGETQGASTIPQQYARNALGLTGGYTRKIKEAAIASKLTQEYTKDKIMEFYLNTVYFGQGAYGIEAAAQTYYGKSAKDLTVEEGMVLAGLIKDPAGQGGKGSPFNPTTDPEYPKRVPDTAQGRFNYIRDGMVELKFLTKEQGEALKYPLNVRRPDPATTGAQWGLDKPTGLIVHHVLDELVRLKAADGTAVFTADALQNGGFKIVTTIDKKAQDAAETAASGLVAGTPMAGKAPNWQASLVAVEPKTGRVRAYYGGPNGDLDYAGFYADPVLGSGEETGYGAHPMGSSFKVYTLAAALIAGYQADSHFDATSPREFPKSGRLKGNPVCNAGCGTPPCKTYCTLAESTVASSNVPFFEITELLGAAKVLEIARAAGVKSMWASVPDANKKLVKTRIDLNAQDVKQVSPKYFSTEVGIGQYPVTVLDHANGVATLAARGAAAPAHFVLEVQQQGATIYAEQVKLTQIPGFTPEMADAETAILKGVVQGNALDGGRESAAKSGTWQFGESTTANAHTTWAGYTAPDPDPKQNNNGLATAVWVGNKDEEQALKLPNGSDAYGYSAAGPVWKNFMNAALKGTPNRKFPDAKPVGHLPGPGASPTPSAPPVPTTPGGPPTGPGGPPGTFRTNGGPPRRTG